MSTMDAAARVPHHEILPRAFAQNLSGVALFIAVRLQHIMVLLGRVRTRWQYNRGFRVFS
jgi:hypothetical protein